MVAQHPFTEDQLTMNYIILEGATLQELTVKVRNQIMDGWQVQGGVAVYVQEVRGASVGDTKYVQAMILPQPKGRPVADPAARVGVPVYPKSDSDLWRRSSSQPHSLLFP